MYSRRDLLRRAAVLLGTCQGMVKVPAALANVVAPLAAKPLQHDATLDASIAPGTRLRVVARSGLPPLPNKMPWHGAPDGGACVACDDGGWIYVSNSELDHAHGGASALRFSAQGELVDSYRILGGTTRNCAGGMTPWQTWLSCEESGDNGLVYECDPFGKKIAQVRPALGAFNHEAVAVDHDSGMLYLTEDQPDGCLYRFVPEKSRDLARGVLQVAVKNNDTLQWVALSDVGARSLPLRYQQRDAARFAGGEGIAWHRGIAHNGGTIFFTTKYDNRVWSYHCATQRISIAYDAARYAQPVLTGVDNLCIGAQGELIVVEDGGDMQVVVVPLHGDPFPLVMLHGQDKSEITGVAFAPDYSRLYFSSQRGVGGDDGDGITYELSLR